MSGSCRRVVAAPCITETSFMAEAEATRAPNWIPALTGAIVTCDSLLQNTVKLDFYLS